jgi:hypothetical protein
MAKIVDLISIFVASPADVSAERNALERVVEEVNLILESYASKRLELVRWETHAHPAAGNDPQDVINKQLGEDYDVFIGIFWSRIGTPTPRAASGSVEEFEAALERHRKSPGSIEIMVYFKDEAIPPSQIDPEQLRSIQEFKSQLTSLGILFFAFKNLEEFSRLARIHLAKVARDRERSGRMDTKPTTQTLVHDAAIEQLEAQYLTDLDDPDAGVLDYDQIFVTSNEKLSVIQGELNATTEREAKIFTGLGRELVAATTNFAKLRVSERIAREMELYAAAIEGSLPTIERCLHRASISASRTLALRAKMGPIDSAELSYFFSMLDKAVESIGAAVEGITSMRNTLVAIPNFVASVNRAKRRLAKAIDAQIEAYKAGQRLFTAIKDAIPPLE